MFFFKQLVLVRVVFTHLVPRNGNGMARKSEASFTSQNVREALKVHASISRLTVNIRHSSYRKLNIQQHLLNQTNLKSFAIITCLYREQNIIQFNLP